MATLSEIIILWWLFTDSQFPFDFVISNAMTELKRKGYQEYIDQLKHLRMKLQEVASSAAITKIEKQYVRLQLIRFFNSAPDIAGFTDKPVVQFHVRVVENTSVDDFK